MKVKAAPARSRSRSRGESIYLSLVCHPTAIHRYRWTVVYGGFFLLAVVGQYQWWLGLLRDDVTTAIATNDWKTTRRNPRRTQYPSEIVHLNDLNETQQAQFGAWNLSLESWSRPDFFKQAYDNPHNAGNIVYGQLPRVARAFPEAWNRTWTIRMVDALIQTTLHNNRPPNPSHYPGAGYQILAALLDWIVLPQSNPKVLVAGSISPWVESIVLAAFYNRSMQHPLVYVTDYQSPTAIQDERIQFIPMQQLLSATDTQQHYSFDAIVSFSSIEHDGLGRYGDPINPFGDLAAMAEFYSLLKPNGWLLLGIPYSETQARVEYNWHRIYSPQRLQVLQEGFDERQRILPFTKQLAERFAVTQQSLFVKRDTWHDQPLFCWQKKANQLPRLLRSSVRHDDDMLLFESQ